jgi:mannose-1-phosphate guanylyltransferase
MDSHPNIRSLLLAAGQGTRLAPLTRNWPKCLMPIGTKPLLEYWLSTLYNTKVTPVLVNLHHHADHVKRFLDRPCFKGWVHQVYETELLGTAGTLAANRLFFKDHTTLLIHADNWCQCDFTQFVAYHLTRRPKHCPITMMTFATSTPWSCGIVETDEQGVVQAFHEKQTNPPGNLANAAVYLLEPEILDWLEDHPKITDVSTQVLPSFMGQIATWENTGIHKDIGTPSMLLQAQQDPIPQTAWPEPDDWSRWFENHPIHQKVNHMMKTETERTAQ